MVSVSRGGADFFYEIGHRPVAVRRTVQGNWAAWVASAKCVGPQRPSVGVEKSRIPQFQAVWGRLRKVKRPPNRHIDEIRAASGIRNIKMDTFAMFTRPLLTTPYEMGEFVVVAVTRLSPEFSHPALAIWPGWVGGKVSYCRR